MAEQTPNGTADLLSPAPTYTIDDEDPVPTGRGEDPNEQEPSLTTGVSTEPALERKPSRQNEAALAEKTSKIMSDYQAYLSEIESEFPASENPDDVAADKAINAVRNTHRHMDQTFPPAREGEFDEANDGVLYRGWSGGSGIHIDRGVSDFEDKEMSMRRGKTGRLGNRRRIRRGLAMVMLVAMIVTVSVAVSKKRKRDSLPDWEAELAETEAQMNGGQTTHNEKLTQAEEMQYAAVSTRFQPTFYDRHTGWTGQTYLEALSFCQDSNPYKDGNLKICPYAALCPGGQGSRPLQGHKNENGVQNIMEYGGSWMPVIDGPNQWVSVGNDNSCVLWSDLHNGGEPEWEVNGNDNESNTRHLACCNADAVNNFEVEEMAQEQKKEEEDAAVELAMASDTTQMSTGVNPAEVGDETDLNLMAYIAAADKYKPVYFDRSSGWDGTSYREAVNFCETKNSKYHVCPFQAVCPHGIGELPIRSFNTDEMMWIPVSDEANSWVSVTVSQPCLPFKNQQDWGPNSDVSIAMTEYLVCCKITSDDGGHILSISDLDGASTAATTPIEAIVADGVVSQDELNAMQIQSAYETTSKMFEPVVYDRTSGWEGRTYLEALDFCAKTSTDAQRSICPLAAICPMGRGSTPVTGAKDGPNEDGMWAPISDDANAWVHVSSFDSCLTYDYMNKVDESPHWGLSGEDNEEITRNVFCCLTDPIALSPNTSPNPTRKPTPKPSTPAVESISSDLSAEEEMLYEAAATVYQPLLYNRASTPAWTGTAYLEALQFCASLDSRIPCPFTGICPGGQGKSPMGGIKSGYMPIFNHPNAWVSVGPDGTCQTYSEINGSPPRWGLTGEGASDLTQNIACCIDVEDDKSDATSEAENGAQTGVIKTEEEQVVLDTFKPEWFGRDAGYQGTTYEGAIDFCSNVAGKSLCPYLAYCPNGSQSSIFLNLKPFEGEQWAPFLTQDGDIGYVMIGTYDGDTDSTCKSFSEVTGIQSAIAMNGSDLDKKTMVLCCHDPTFSTHGVITPTVEDDLNVPVTQTVDSPTLEDGSLNLEVAVTLDLEPVWLDNEDGWNGGSHDDAEAFCNQLLGKSLCPYAAYCPHGPGQPVIGGHTGYDFTTEGLQWSPVFGASNHWVLLSQKSGNSATTCMSHTDLEGSEPEWGLSNERPWLKKHIMCCNLKNGY